MIITSKKVTEILNISDSTLRKWCIELEKGGYLFNRDTRNQRIFSQNDLAYLEYFKQLVQKNRLLLQDAVTIIIKKSNGESPTFTIDTNKLSILTHDELVDEMLQFIRRQMRFVESQEKINKELLVQIESLTNKIHQQNEEFKIFIFRCVKESEERLLTFIKHELKDQVVDGEMYSNETYDQNQSIIKRFFDRMR